MNCDIFPNWDWDVRLFWRGNEGRDNPVTNLPEVTISSRKPQLRFISFHPRNHQRNEEGVEVHSKIELQPLNKDGFETIEIPEDNEAKIATIGVLKYIIR